MSVNASCGLADADMVSFLWGVEVPIPIRPFVPITRLSALFSRKYIDLPVGRLMYRLVSPDPLMKLYSLLACEPFKYTAPYKLLLGHVPKASDEYRESRGLTTKFVHGDDVPIPTDPLPSIVSAEIVDVENAVGEEVAIKREFPAERNVQGFVKSEPSESASCARVDDASESVNRGVVVPIPTTGFVRPFG